MPTTDPENRAAAIRALNRARRVLDSDPSLRKPAIDVLPALAEALRLVDELGLDLAEDRRAVAIGDYLMAHQGVEVLRTDTRVRAYIDAAVARLERELPLNGSASHSRQAWKMLVGGLGTRGLPADAFRQFVIDAAAWPITRQAALWVALDYTRRDRKAAAVAELQDRVRRLTAILPVEQVHAHLRGMDDRLQRIAAPPRRARRR